MSEQDDFFKELGSSRETVADAGEEGILSLVKRVFPEELLSPEWITIPTFGDDAAVFGRKILAPDEELVITADVLVEGADFLFSWMSPNDLGYKSVMVNVSDLASMGASPIGMVVSLGLQDETSMLRVESFLDGMLEAALMHKIVLLGGDLSESKTFFCNVTMLGKVPEGKALTRGDVIKGDVIAVTGFPGEARAGLMICLGKANNVRSEEKVFINRFFKPDARINAGLILRDYGGIRGCIDLSDGIARDSWRIAKRNHLKVEIDSEKLPATDLLKNFWQSRGHNPYKEIITGGEDFELMFCCEPGRFAGLKEIILEETGLMVTEIGRLEDGAGAFCRMPDNNIYEMTSWGFDHFEKPGDQA